MSDRPDNHLAHSHPDCRWRRRGEPVPLTYDEAAEAAALGIDRCPLCVMDVVR